MADAHDPYAALRLPDFRRILLGFALSSVGVNIERVAVGWYLAKRTDDTLAIGLVGLVMFLPVLLLALPAGHAADRYNRKHLLMAAQCLTMTATLGLAAVAHFEGHLPLIYLFLLLAGIGDAFSSPARWSLLPQVVPIDLLNSAVTWNSSSWQIASLVGPALASGLIFLGGGEADVAFGAASLCLLAAVVVLAPIRQTTTAVTRRAPSLESLLAGVRFVASSRLILATITLDLFAVLFGGATALIPFFVNNVLGGGPAALGWLEAAPGAGALVMGFILAHRPPMRRAGPSLLLAVAGFGVANVAFAVSTNLYFSFAMLALAGALDNISVVVRSTLVQTLTPDAMRGRVTAVNSLFINSSNRLGDFESGAAARWLGLVPSVVAGGLATVGVVLGVAFLWPEVWRLGALRDAKPRGEDEAVVEDAKLR